jgi:hypothetical protein
MQVKVMIECQPHLNEIKKEGNNTSDVSAEEME